MHQHSDLSVCGNCKQRTHHFQHICNCLLYSTIRKFYIIYWGLKQCHYAHSCNIITCLTKVNYSAYVIPNSVPLLTINLIILAVNLERWFPSSLWQSLWTSIYWRTNTPFVSLCTLSQSSAYTVLSWRVFWLGRPGFSASHHYMWQNLGTSFHSGIKMSIKAVEACGFTTTKKILSNCVCR